MTCWFHLLYMLDHRRTGQDHGIALKMQIALKIYLICPETVLQDSKPPHEMWLTDEKCWQIFYKCRSFAAVNSTFTVRLTVTRQATAGTAHRRNWRDSPPPSHRRIFFFFTSFLVFSACHHQKARVSVNCCASVDDYMQLITQSGLLLSREIVIQRGVQR